MRRIEIVLVLAIVGFIGCQKKSHQPLPGPRPPSNLKAVVDPEQLAVVLTWQDNSDDEEGFILEKGRKQAISVSQTFELPANTEGYLDRGVRDGGDYCYWVAAFNKNGKSESTSRVCLVVDFPEPPPVPTNLQLNCSDFHFVELSWDKPSAWWEGSMEGFIIKKKEGEGEWQEIYQGSVESKSNTDWFPAKWSYFYRDYSVQAGKVYCYRVASFRGKLISRYSHESCWVCQFPELIQIESFPSGITTNIPHLPLVANLRPIIGRVGRDLQIALRVNGKDQEFWLQYRDVWFEKDYLCSQVKLEEGANTILISVNLKTGGFTEKEAIVYYDPSFSLAERGLVYCLLGKALVILDANSMSCFGWLLLPDEYQRLEISPRDSKLYLIGKNQILIIETAFQTLIGRFELPEEFKGVSTISKDGEFLFLGNNRRVVVYDTENWQVFKSFESKSWLEVKSLSLNPSESKLYVGLAKGGVWSALVEVYLLPEFRFATKFPTGIDAYLKTIAISPDEKWGVVTNASWRKGDVFVFDAITDQVIDQFKTPNDFANYAWFEPDSQIFWVTDSQNLLRVETQTRKILEQSSCQDQGLYGKDPNYDFRVKLSCRGLVEIDKIPRKKTDKFGGRVMFCDSLDQPACIKDMAYKP